MKIALTGGAGFIGQHVTQYLLRHTACEVLWIDQNFAVEANPRLQVLSSAIEDLSALDIQKIASCDSLIHLAWGNLDQFTATAHLTEVLPSHIDFLEKIIQAGLKNICAVGTCLEYGLQEGELSEGMASNPSLPYSIAKDSLRRHLMFLNKDATFHLTWVRLFYMFGQGQNPKSLLPSLKIAAENGDEFFPMSPGDQLRDYLPVELVAKNISELALLQQNVGIVNCCSGQPTSVLDFVGQYLRLENINIKLKTGVFNYPFYEPRNFWGSTRKMTSLLTQKKRENHERD